MLKKEFLPWKLTFKYFEQANIIMGSPAGDFNASNDYDGEWYDFDQ